MKPLHQRRKPLIYAHAQDTEFSVLRMAPQYPAGPEHVVCAGSDAVAHFFSEDDALKYAAWKNQSPPRPARTT